MTKENYTGTQNLGQKIENLVVENNVVFVKFKYYTVLEKMIDVLEKLGYSTNLFKAEWDKWNYSSPNNLLMIKNNLIRYPNEDYYLEIDTRDKFYTVCNSWTKNRALENLHLKIAVVTTSIY